MNDDRSLERAARDWAEHGPNRAPDRAVDAALARIQTMGQERDLPFVRRLPNLNTAGRLVAGLAAVVVVVVAGALVLRPGTGTGGPPTPSPSPSPTLELVPSPTPSVAACTLLTDAEVADTFLNPGLGAQPTGSGGGAETSCIWTDGGLNVILRVTYTTSGGLAAFEAAQGLADAEVVAGVGTNAVFDRASETLYVSKGDALVAILAGDPTFWGVPGPDARLDAETRQGKLIAGRM